MGIRYASINTAIVDGRGWIVGFYVGGVEYRFRAPEGTFTTYRFGQLLGQGGPPEPDVEVLFRTPEMMGLYRAALRAGLTVAPAARAGRSS